MPRQLREVVFVDGVRTPFGKAKGQYAETRADDLVIKCIRELMRRNPGLPPERVDEVAIAATTQIGDQGLTIGRTAALLSGLPQSVPGYAIDRMCAGAMTAVTTTAGGIAFGSYDVAIAGGVEHMGRHPMGEGVDPNPRILSERIVNPDALVMGKTAENLHDRYPTITKERVDAYAVRSQAKTAAAYEAGAIQPDLVPVATRSAEQGWGLALSAEAVGLLLMTLVLLRVRLERPLLVGMIGIMALGLPIYMLGAHPHLLWLLLATFIAGAGTELFNMGWNLAMQEQVPDEMLSRAYSYDALGSFAAMPVGQVLFGPLAVAFGFTDVLVVSGIVYVAVCGLVLLSPEVRRLARAPQADPAPAPA